MNFSIILLEYDIGGSVIVKGLEKWYKFILRTEIYTYELIDLSINAIGLSLLS